MVLVPLKVVRLKGSRLKRSTAGHCTILFRVFQRWNNNMILSVRRTRKKIRVPDGIWTHHLPWSSRMLQPLSYWKLYGEQGPICGSRLELHHAATQPSKGVRLLSQKIWQEITWYVRIGSSYGRNRILVPFTVWASLPNFPRALPSFLYESPPGGQISSDIKSLTVWSHHGYFD